MKVVSGQNWFWGPCFPVVASPWKQPSVSGESERADRERHSRQREREREWEPESEHSQPGHICCKSIEFHLPNRREVCQLIWPWKYCLGSSALQSARCNTPRITTAQGKIHKQSLHIGLNKNCICVVVNICICVALVKAVQNTGLFTSTLGLLPTQTGKHKHIQQNSSGITTIRFCDAIRFSLQLVRGTSVIHLNSLCSLAKMCYSF